ncbi:DUF362 domain-containing protein [Candidatus Bathyarchaeota archaeon]|nr:DUF362 domain-containing protein [Candidatus Bathyarchaeota archaeon]
MCNISRVAIIKGSDPTEITVRALEALKLDLDVVLSTEKPILIKPNYITAQHPSTGITTDGKVVEGVVKFLKERGKDNIIIGEGSGWAETFEAFKVAEIDKISEKWKVKLVDLNKDVFVEVYPPNPMALRKVKVAKTALESVIISVPKLKLHRLTTVTLGIKNMMGALASKGSMHNGRLHANIADLASVLKPSLTVIDGIIAGEGHETSGNPVKMDLVIAGTDPVAVDAVGAAVMGVSPTEVEHLVLAEKKGLGTCQLEKIEVIGEPIEKVKRKFRRSITSKILEHF